MTNNPYEGAEEFFACILLGPQKVSIQAKQNEDAEEVTAGGARYIAKNEIPEDALISRDHPTFPELNAKDVVLYYADMLDDDVPPDDYHEVDK